MNPYIHTYTHTHIPDLFCADDAEYIYLYTLQVCLPYLVGSFVTRAAIPTYLALLARELTSCLHLLNPFHLLASPSLPLSRGFAHLSHPPSLLSLHLYQSINQSNSQTAVHQYHIPTLPTPPSFTCRCTCTYVSRSRSRTSPRTWDSAIHPPSPQTAFYFARERENEKVV